jgi:hypothetical protein
VPPACEMSQSTVMRRTAAHTGGCPRSDDTRTFTLSSSSRCRGALRTPGGTTPRIPKSFAGLYSAAQRKRLASSGKDIHLADQVIREVVEAYAAPDAFDELRECIRGDEPPDALKDFGEACRIELRTSAHKA